MCTFYIGCDCNNLQIISWMRSKDQNHLILKRAAKFTNLSYHWNLLHREESILISPLSKKCDPESYHVVGIIVKQKKICPLNKLQVRFE